MKILFDHGTPVPLRHALSGHDISTAYEMGWAKFRNGDLLAAAEKAFAAVITTDKNLCYQQNLAGRRLAIQVLPTTSWPRLQKHLSEIEAAVNALKSGDYIELDFPQDQ
jgi:predicted nuclease of predicted toxin-antitoxin system